MASREFPHLFLCRYAGEIGVKAKATRDRFSQRLEANLRDALAAAGIAHDVRRTWSRIFVGAERADAGEVLARVFGVRAVSPATERPLAGLDRLLADGEEIFAPRIAGKTFAVRVGRGGQRRYLDVPSPEVERQLGSRLAPYARGVDLVDPEVEVRIQLEGKKLYFFSAAIAAQGGLPIGTEGRAVALVSGGFDSAVAAWAMLRRGMRLDYLFCNLGGEAHRDGVLAVMKVIADRWSFGYRPRLHLVDFREIVEQMQDRCPPRLWQVLLKRQMLLAASRLARSQRAHALVTGEVVGQVSSQTVQNLRAISSATELPILRPLIGADKDEIVAQARAIGTYAASEKVPEYCALDAKRPETHARPEPVLEAESQLSSARLATLVDQRATLDLRAFDPEAARSVDLAVGRVPAGATVLDLRSPAAFRGWHYPGARHLDYREAIAHHADFDADAHYLCFCEVGLKSAHLAELLHRRGVKAAYFGPGLKQLMREADGDDPALAAALSPALLD